jgi:hypothetical protein
MKFGDSSSKFIYGMAIGTQQKIRIAFCGAGTNARKAPEFINRAKKRCRQKLRQNSFL